MSENAILKSVWIGIEDHGIPAVSILLEGSSWSQSTGAYDLRQFNFAGFLEALVRVTETNELSEVRNKVVRIERDGDMIRRILHPIKNNTLDIQSFCRKGLTQ